VLVCSNIAISLLRKFIPDQVRIPAFIVVIATFVTMVQLIMQAFLPSLYDSLGIFIPLIVVNCIILARAEAFASKNGPVLSAADGLGMGVGFTLALTLIGTVRELIGSGSVFGQNILGASYEPMLLIVLASGGFLTFGLLLGIFNLIVKKIERKRTAKEAQAA
jgi:electron transport complex protein RnfE